MAVAAVLALRSVAAQRIDHSEQLAGRDRRRRGRDDLLHERILTYRLDGALFFGAAQRFLTELTAVTDVRVVILRLPRCRCSTPPAPRRSVRSSPSSKHRGITVLVKGPRPDHLRTLAAVGALDHLAHENHLFDDLDDALRHARARERAAPVP